MKFNYSGAENLSYTAGCTATTWDMAYLPDSQSLRKALWLPTKRDEVNQLDSTDNVHTKLCYQNGRSCSSDEVEPLTQLRKKYDLNGNTENETLKTFSIALAPNSHKKKKAFPVAVCLYNWLQLYKVFDRWKRLLS